MTLSKLWMSVYPFQVILPKIRAVICLYKNADNLLARHLSTQIQTSPSKNLSVVPEEESDGYRLVYMQNKYAFSIASEMMLFQQIVYQVEDLLKPISHQSWDFLVI